MKAKYLLRVVLMCCVVFVAGVTTAQAKDALRMTKEQLKGMLDSPNVVVIDVRIGRDWKASNVKIKGAMRRHPREVKEWASTLDKDKTYVLYCA